MTYWLQGVGLNAVTACHTVGGRHGGAAEAVAGQQTQNPSAASPRVIRTGRKTVHFCTCYRTEPDRTDPAGILGSGLARRPVSTADSSGYPGLNNRESALSSGPRPNRTEPNQTSRSRQDEALPPVRIKMEA